MFKSTTRIASIAPLSRALPRTRAARRFISTAPPHQKSRSWKSSAARWGLAGALVYYYNTATAFAEEPQYAAQVPAETARETETYQTVASITEERKAQARSQAEQRSSNTQSATVSTVADGEAVAPGSPEALEEEASEQGAFNEETGEINWDCPCLGGMAYGPCGEQFRAAFSCFVFSQEEPKGVDCIEHFKTMQNCFREHPDVYGAELDDDEEGAAEALEGETAPVPSDAAPQPNLARTEAAPLANNTSTQPSPSTSIPSAATAVKAPQDGDSTAKSDESSDELVPKAWHDSRDSAAAK